jgi:hypothetical protein
MCTRMPMRCEKLWRERHQGITATGAEATLLERMRYKKPSRNKPLKANRLQRRNPMRYDGYSFIFSNDGFKSSQRDLKFGSLCVN